MPLSLRPGPAARGLRVAGPMVALQGLAGVVYGVYLGIAGVRFGATGPEPVSNVPGLIVEVVLYLGFGAAIVLVGYGVWREASWSRSPAVLAQLLIAVVAVPLAQSSDVTPRTVGIALTATCVTVLVGVFLPGSRRVFDDRRLPGS